MMMIMMHRCKILTHFLIGSIMAIVYVPFPNMVDGLLEYLIKSLNGHVVNHGLYDDESVCGEVQSTGQDTCSVAEEDGGDDGDAGPREANGFIKAGESQSDGSDDEESS